MSPELDSIRWIPRGTPVMVDGQLVNGGGFYLGSGSVPSGEHWRFEPSIIDPSLTVAWGAPDRQASAMTYWPSYRSISTACRAAYLEWLNGTRDQPDTNVGYVFLYYYGLERRVFIDAPMDTGPMIYQEVRSEVARLLTVYGGHDSFRRYATRLLEGLDIILSDGAVAASPQEQWLKGRENQVPLPLAAALGRFVTSETPIPPLWALALLRCHPSSRLRTAATRCPDEFNALFRHYYEEQYGQGLRIKVPKATVRAVYHPASAGFFGPAEFPLPPLPDIAGLSAPIARLGEIGDRCLAELDGYSRRMGRPQGSGPIWERAMLLPAPLLRSHPDPFLAGLREWVRGVRERGTVIIGSQELLTHTMPDQKGKLTKTEATALSGMLASFGLGIEPDPRFGGGTFDLDDDVVVFPLTDASPAAPSLPYTAAMLLLRFAAVVVAADGDVSTAEREHLATHLEDVLGLGVAERQRLDAHMTWLLASKVRLTGLSRRVDSLTVAQRSALASLLVSVAAADGRVTPEEIRILVKAYQLLGLEEAEVYRSIHALGSEDSGPVPLPVPSERDPDWAIPPAEASKRSGVQLDQAKVEARLADTAAVTTLLASVFAADEVLTTPPPASATMEASDLVGGLDATHSTIARQLVSAAAWTRDEAEAMVIAAGLPILGVALDRINEASLEVCGEALIEGDDPLEINSYARQELKL